MISNDVVAHGFSAAHLFSATLRLGVRQTNDRGCCRYRPGMSKRFYVPGLSEQTTQLPPDEAHHFARVLRGQPGEQIELFDGCGLAIAAEVVDVRKKSVGVRCSQAKPPQQRSQVTLAVAPPKGDRFRWLVEKATELGVGTIQPLVAARSVTDPGAGKLDKLRQTAIAACKQSGCNHIPALPPPISLADALALPAEHRLIADRTDATPTTTTTTIQGVATLVLIGPEGGWTDDERTAAADAGFAPLSLGPHVLRTETAAIAAAALLASLVSPA